MIYPAFVCLPVTRCSQLPTYVHDMCRRQNFWSVACRSKHAERGVGRARTAPSELILSTASHRETQQHTSVAFLASIFHPGTACFESARRIFGVGDICRRRVSVSLNISSSRITQKGVQDKMPLDKMPRTKCHGTKCHQQWNLFLFSSNVVSICCLTV